MVKEKKDPGGVSIVHCFNIFFKSSLSRIMFPLKGIQIIDIN